MLWKSFHFSFIESTNPKKLSEFPVQAKFMFFLYDQNEIGSTTLDKNFMHGINDNIENDKNDDITYPKV